jgi:hypothetical protein
VNPLIGFALPHTKQAPVHHLERIGLEVGSRKNRLFSVSSSLCTTSANVGKRCWVHSLRYWSPKTLESTMSVG